MHWLLQAVLAPFIVKSMAVFSFLISNEWHRKLQPPVVSYFSFWTMCAISRVKKYLKVFSLAMGAFCQKCSWLVGVYIFSKHLLFIHHKTIYSKHPPHVGIYLIVWQQFKGMLHSKGKLCHHLLIIPRNLVQTGMISFFLSFFLSFFSFFFSSSFFLSFFLLKNI